jgi:hypothetical protein
MPSCSCWECKEKIVSFAVWMDHDDRPRWEGGWDWCTSPNSESNAGYGHFHGGFPVYTAREQAYADEIERATKVRRTQAEERYQRFVRRELRATKYKEIELHLHSRVTDPSTVLQIEKCYKTIISRALENGSR